MNMNPGMRGRPKVLLLNPPASNVCLRDYFCSKTSRSNYLYPPLDLLILSARLHEDYELIALDCVAEKVSFEEAINRIGRLGVTAVISLVGAVNWREDLAFLKKVKEVSGVPIICCGDLVLEGAQDLFREYGFLDAAIFDFFNEDLLCYLKGDFGSVSNMLIRVDGRLVEKRTKPARSAAFTIPVPRHELFLDKPYCFPFARRSPFTVVLTDFGCPFTCPFCVMSTLGYKYRSVENVLAELEYLKGLGIKEIYFADQCFGAVRDRGLELCRRMIEDKFDFTWSCFSRADLLDEENLSIYKRCGCHTVIIGVESGDDDILKLYKNGSNRQRLASAFKLCEKLKIRTVGTFILGFPEDTRQTCLKTIELARELNCDFASFHVAVPRAATPLRRKAIEMELIGPQDRSMDQSGRQIAMPTQRLTREEIEGLRKKAVRDFYLRPGYLLRRVFGAGSFSQMLEQAREFFFLIRNNL